MKKVLSVLFALMAMGIAMFVVATLLHIDVKAEIENLISGEGGVEPIVDVEPIVEAPEV